MNRRRFLQTAAALPTGMLGGCRGDAAIAGGIVGGSHLRGHRLRELSSTALPFEQRRKCDVLVVGGGVAGLSAARRLAKAGIEKVVVLELESAAGGASISGRNAVSAYPWGAHYLPLPGSDCAEVLQFLEETGIITGHDAAGRPVYDEFALCHDPHERLFIHGEWIEGLVPDAGLDAAGRAQFEAFHTEIRRWHDRRGRDGRPAFTLPVDRSSRDPEILALDLQSMDEWMQGHGFQNEALRWFVNYCVQDDFGGGLDEVSAWAGVHYFASRSGEAANAERDTVLTWPQGNGYLVEQLRNAGGFEVITDQIVLSVQHEGAGVRVHAAHTDGGGTTWEARAVLLAAPRFVSRRLLDPRAGSPDLTYSPWVVANLTLDELPPSSGVLPAWDNVVFGGPSLGYVNARHQSLDAVPRDTVITHYETVGGRSPAETREWMLTQSHAQWCDRILNALEAPHPDLAEHVRQIDVWLWGHGMIRPVPGFLWGDARRALNVQTPPVFFAHSDMSGMSLFEEAFTQGSQVADAVAQWLGRV
jgi:glycine/D-amino acid oxidase-like deaminating enzyme